MAQENFSITENSDLHFLFLPKGRKSPKGKENALAMATKILSQNHTSSMEQN
jgi:hypothetical protein